jgi:enoyl-CoA hydratase/carnithine racemase
MSSTSSLRLQIEGDLATLWLDRPEKQNAMTFEMWAALPSLLAEVEQSTARVLVIRGSGPHFCAGADISTIGEGLADAGADGYRSVNEAAEEALACVQRPTLAVIDGNCIGGGCQLITACDLRLATTDARFGITPAKLGITYPANAILRTADLIGTGATKRLLYTSDLIDAAEAHRIGLVDVLADPASLDETAAAICATLCSRSLVTQLATKDLLHARLIHTQEMNAVIGHWEQRARQGEDLIEGLAAFADRRSPEFQWHPEGQPGSD